MRHPKIGLILAVMLGLLLSVSALYAEPSAQGGGIDTTTTSTVNLRSGPGTDWRIITSLPAGTPFRVGGRANGDYWLRGITSSGEVGWVAIDGLAVSADQIASLPYMWADDPFNLAPPGGAPAPVDQPAEQPVQVAPTPVPTTAPVVNTAPTRGFAYGGHVQAFGDYAAQQMQLAGMTWVKRQVRYTLGQDPSTIAGWINDAHARGFRILLGVLGEPQQLYNEGYFETYANFLAGLAVLGADGVEVWNEPNIDREWPAGSINPASYVDLLRVSYNAVKAANPNTLVISGAPAPTGYFGGCTGAGCDDNYYIQGMFAAGAANYMDCLGIHYNEGILPPNATQGDPRGSSDHYSRYFRSMINTYVNASGGRRPLCFTEMGYLSGDGYPPLPGAFGWAENVTVEQQAQWLDQAVTLASQSGRVRLFIIWNIDFTTYDSDPQAGFAIIRPGGGCPACELLGS